MTEASVSFAGNLTDDPEVRYTEAPRIDGKDAVRQSALRPATAGHTAAVSWVVRIRPTQGFLAIAP
jgi:single-stranded DNA-binding protein